MDIQIDKDIALTLFSLQTTCEEKIVEGTTDLMLESGKTIVNCEEHKHF